MICFLILTAELIMYADDMTLIVPGKSRADVVNIANEQLVHVFSWLINNKLIVNTAKTKYMIFSPKSRNTKTTCEPDTQLKIANISISEVDNFKFLGVIVSNNLSWKAHMLCVRNKLRACLALIYKSCDNLTRSCMLTLFFSFAYSHINYCISTSCSTNFCLLDYLQRCCNKILRIIFFRDSRSNCDDYIKSLKF